MNNQKDLSEKELEQEISNFITPVLIEHALQQGFLDKSLCKDPDYVISVITSEPTINIIEKLGFLIETNDEYDETLKHTLENKFYKTSLILAATIVENDLNMFYRLLLWEKDVEEKNITEIIRKNNFDSKFGWLFKYATKYEFDVEIKKKLISIIELRNSIVHYKFEPDIIDIGGGSFDKTEAFLEKIDFTELESTLLELKLFLEQILDKCIKFRSEAKEIAVFLSEQNKNT